MQTNSPRETRESIRDAVVIRIEMQEKVEVWFRNHHRYLARKSAPL